MTDSMLYESTAAFLALWLVIAALLCFGFGAYGRWQIRQARAKGCVCRWHWFFVYLHARCPYHERQYETQIRVWIKAERTRALQN